MSVLSFSSQLGVVPDGTPMTRGRFARVDADAVLGGLDSLLDEAEAFRRRLSEAFDHAESEGKRIVGRMEQIRTRLRGTRG